MLRMILIALALTITACGDTSRSTETEPTKTTAPTTGQNNVPADPQDQAEPDPRDTMFTVQWIGIEQGDFGNGIKFRVNNQSGRDVDSVVLGIHFLDQFGDRLSTFGMKVTHDETLPAGESFIKSGQWPGTPARAIELADTGRATMTARVDKIVFTDGEAIDYTR